MACALDCPHETLFHIFSYLDHNNSDRDRRTLLDSALVCRSWRDPAQRTLHESVVLKCVYRPAAEWSLWLEGEARSRFTLQKVALLGGKLTPANLVAFRVRTMALDGDDLPGASSEKEEASVHCLDDPNFAGACPSYLSVDLSLWD